MTHHSHPRIKESTTTSGTANFALAGVVRGHVPFASVLAENDTCYYVATDGGSRWEYGRAKLLAGNILERCTVLTSSDAGNKVAFAAGTKQVFLVNPPASGFRTIDATATLSPLDESVAIDATADNVTATLPRAVARTGQMLRLVRIDGTGNTVTITPDGSEQISGELSLSLDEQWQPAVLLSTGSGWLDLSPGTGGGGSPGLVWRGAWDNATAYVEGDAVEHDGSSYIATGSTTGDEPPVAPWELLAAKGDTGATGDPGATGDTGAQGEPGLVWQGAWDVGTGYVEGDAVEHDGSSYIATGSTTGDEPPAAPWELLAAKGDDGDPGDTGATGATGPQGEPGLVWQGAWDVGTGYVEGDAVEHDGSSYIATGSTTGDEPPAAPWELLAAKGDTGESGGALGLLTPCRLNYTSATLLTLAKHRGRYVYNPLTDETVDLDTEPTVSNSGLSSSTFYYCYLDTGTGALSLSTTASTQTDGIDHQTGDTGKLLMGWARTNSSTQFVQSSSEALVSSLYNPHLHQIISTGGENNLTADGSYKQLTTNVVVGYLRRPDLPATIFGEVTLHHDASTALTNVNMQLEVVGGSVIGSSFASSNATYQYWSFVGVTGIDQEGSPALRQVQGGFRGSSSSPNTFDVSGARVIGRVWI